MGNLESPQRSAISQVDIPFPPTDEGVGKLVGFCDRKEQPIAFGKDVVLEKYNAWLDHSETGLRVSYDDDRKRVIIREGCALSHGSTRMAFRTSLKVAFAGTYAAANGRIETPPASQNVTPDCSMGACVGGNRTFPVLAEVGTSQNAEALNARAELLLQVVPGASVVVLINIHDNTSVENGRMQAWCATLAANGTLTLSNVVEFGRVGAGGAPRNAWAPRAAPPTITVPAHGAVAATPVSLGDILVDLRGMGKSTIIVI